MATSGISSGTAAIDVAGMVEGLMGIENRPLITLQSKITSQNLMISDLGQLKSKVAAFQTALQAVENPDSYSSAVASSSNESAVTVSSSTGALIGNHQITVTQLAKPAQYIFADSDFTTSDALVGFLDSSTFDLTVAGQLNSLSVDSTTTIEDLSTFINGLGLSVAASITQTTSGQYALIIQGTQSGEDNDVTFGVNGSLDSHPISSAAALASPSVTAYGNQAQDAEFTLDGLMEFTRTTNNVDDVLSGTTFNLVSTGIANITLVTGPDNGREVIQAFITAFNDLTATSKKLTQKGNSSTAAGSLAGSPGALFFINQIKSMLSEGITYESGGVSTALDLYELGIDINSDGTLEFNAVNYGSTDGIATILASGINIGSTSFSDTDNLDAFLTSQIQAGGDLSESIRNEQDTLYQMSEKEVALQMRLDSKEKSYISQYSSLNALLFKLNNTSSALTSALAGLVDGQNNN
ncbi:MAG: flagellar filament capping protein FliD [Rhodoferax sp.]|uniref:flagellar filament capping protein FliD n=1 Tax=Polynucleobacter sp. MG-Unter2-18 TaxID=2081052 RepID=UPI001BFE884B|nr:flagellar filament capping protein FliD [Polynucleobacter sp. MG-Unter2-18]MCF8165438.1 flagellar filament capping protein FliD [Rhodoferax sp.]QWD94966.1 flagellar filament capping protein FliD [Polynucleobacter sp. MG-Unter2-18]